MLVLFLLSTLLLGVLTAPVRTSLCCCGCSQEPCPVVGPSCGAPQQQCDSKLNQELVQCDELQRLWELAELEKENVSVPQKQKGPSSPFTPFLAESGLPYTIHEQGSSGSQQTVQHVYQSGAVVPAFFKSASLLHGSGENSDFNKSQAGIMELRFSPQKRVVVAEETRSEIDRAKKLDIMLSELQTMIAMVKGLMASEVAAFTQAHEKNNVTVVESESGAISSLEEFPLPLDPVSEEEEKQAIDDVIKRMKGAFRKTNKVEERTRNEVDATLPPSVISIIEEDIANSGVSTSQPNRAKRASGSKKKHNSDMGNCNDSKLKEIIMKNIGSDAKSSKRVIQKAAEKEFGGTFNVICSPCEFSFVISSQKYCEGFKDQVACFVFLQPPTTVKEE